MATSPAPDRLSFAEADGPWAAPAVHRLHRQCFFPGEGDYWRDSDIAQLLRQSGGWALIANAPDGQGLAFGLFRQIFDECEIVSLGVVPGARGRGHGHALLCEALARGAGRGIGRWFLEVRADNPTARALYGRLGFARVGLRRGYYRRLGGNRVDALTLSLDCG